MSSESLPSEQDDLEAAVRLDRQSRRIGLLLLILVSGGLVTAVYAAQAEPASQQTSIEASMFVIRDAQGRIQARFGVNPIAPGEPAVLVMFDAEDRPRAALLYSDDKQTASLQLFDTRGVSRAILSLQDSERHCQIALADREERLRNSVYLDSGTNLVHSAIFNTDGDSRAAMTYDAQHGGFAEFRTAAGRVYARAAASPQ